MPSSRSGATSRSRSHCSPADARACTVSTTPAPESESSPFMWVDTATPSMVEVSTPRAVG